MSGNKNKRQVKVYPKHVPRVGKTIIVPEIRLCGKYLKEYGFEAGQTITIVCEPEKLTLTVIK